MNTYLKQVPVMVEGSEAFDVFTHIDYAVRLWPVATTGPFDPRVFEDGFRAALRSIAEGGRVLETNTRRLWSWVPECWADSGGEAVSFASDAHTPEAIASDFPEAAAMLEHFGFRPGSTSEEFWVRSRTI